MQRFLENTNNGKYIEALAWMKENKAALLSEIREFLLEDDHNSFYSWEEIYDNATNIARNAGPTAAHAREFADLLKAYILESISPEYKENDILIFKEYEERYRKRKTGKYYQYLKDANYEMANDFIKIKDNRDAVLITLTDEFVKRRENENAYFYLYTKPKWQNLYDSILDNNANETADILRELITQATGGFTEDLFAYPERRAARIQREMQEAMIFDQANSGEVSNSQYSVYTLPPRKKGGGRKSRRRGRKSRRRVFTSKR